MYDKPNNKAFIDKIEKGQHDTALAITSEMKGHLKKISMLKLALNLSNLCDGLWNWMVFIKFS